MTLRADVATGETTLYEVDVRLPGYLPVALARSYHSSAEIKGLFGHRWRFNFDITLQVASERILVCDGAGRIYPFKPVEVGMQVIHQESGLLLQHHTDAYVVYLSPLVQHIFLKQNAVKGLHRLDRLEDLNGNTVQFTYRDGRLVALVDTLGRRVGFDYAGDLCTALRVAGPQEQEAVTVRTFRYDQSSDLVAFTDAARKETRYTYQNHLMVACTNRLGGTRYAKYDADGRCLALWRSDNAEVRLLAYDDTRQTTRVANTGGRQTIYRRSVAQQVLEQIDPLAGNQVYRYDAARKLTGFSDVGGAPATFQQLDPAKGALALIDGKKRMAFFQFNASGLAETIADGLKNEYAFSYDDKLNIVRVTTPLEAVWTYERDRRGGVTDLVSPEGRRVRFKRSTDGREIIVQDDLGLRYTERYDLFGRRTERVDALGRRQQWAYDSEGRLTTFKIEGVHEVRFTFDAEGNLLGTTDTRQRMTKRQYDSFGTLVAYTSEDGRRWQFNYDPEGRLVTAATEGKTARFDYDWHGRLVRSVAFDGRTHTYHYAAGPMIKTRNGEGETVRWYTPLMDLMVETLPDGTERRLKYGPSGEVREEEGPAGKHRFTYDEEGRIAVVQKEQLRLALGYDRDGNLVSVQDADEHGLTLRYDKRGRLVEMQEASGASWRFDYDKGDRLTTLEGTAGVKVAFRYGLLDRLRERNLEADGTAPAYHRFRSKHAGEVVTDRLTPRALDAPDTQRSGPGEAGILLLQTAFGLVLVAQFGDLGVPVWFQDDLLRAKTPGLAARIVQACLQGPDALLQRRRFPGGPALYRRYAGGGCEGFRFLYTELPRAQDAALPSEMLDMFFLERVFYDYFDAPRPLGSLPHHQADLARSADQVLTGSHMQDYLKPRVWDHHAMSPLLDQTYGLHKPGGLRPDDVIHHFAKAR